MSEKFESLLGRTIVSVEKTHDELTFITGDAEQFRLYHEQDCCESVTISDVCGDFADLIGLPLLQADESSNSESDDDKDESVTWTFYRMTTMKGQVVITWCGSSNGYYSESVSFEQCKVGQDKLREWSKSDNSLLAAAATTALL